MERREAPARRTPGIRHGQSHTRPRRITASLDKDTGGHLYTPLSRGLDRAFARFYVRFEEDPGYIHHFVHVGGYRPATRWPQGGAGTRPRGDERFTVGIEPSGQSGRVPAPGVWNLYTYWHEMKVSAGGRYWGNGLHPPRPQTVPRGRWQCVELMIQCNTPGKRDGELALWLEGKPIVHFRKGMPRSQWSGMGFQSLEGSEAKSKSQPFEGFSFRKTAELKVNFFWLLHYVTETNARRNRDGKKVNRVWFDHIVVSEKYIGPIKPIAKQP